MSAALIVQLTPEAESLVRAMRTMPERVVRAVAAGMDKANQFALARIRRNHMSGKGPFPVAEHKVGVVSGLLRGSVHASPATITSASTVESGIGTNVIYGRLHELGGRVHHEARKVKVRLRTDARGNLMRQFAGSHLAIFASKEHSPKRVRETEHDAEAYDVDMPERAYIRTGLEESAGDYRLEISAAIAAEWNREAKT